MLKTTLYLLAFFAISVLHSKERKNIMLPYNELKHDLKKTVQKEIVFTNLRLPKIVYKGYQKGLKSDLEGIIEINGQSRIVKKGSNELVDFEGRKISIKILQITTNNIMLTVNDKPMDIKLFK